MSTCSPQSLMDSAACFACRTEEEKSTLELALLYAWSESTQTVQELMDSAACFACRTEEEKSTLELQLLCEIFNAEPEPPVGCQPVTDETVYSGGTNDPQAAPWVVVGGTATTVGFDVQVTGSITGLYVQNADGIPWYDGTFDFTPIASCLERLGFDYTYISTPPDVTGLPNLTFFGLYDTQIVSFTQQANTSITHFAIYTSGAFETQFLTDLDVSGFTNVVIVEWANNSVLTTVNITGCTQILTVVGYVSALDVTSIDHVLTTLDANGLSNGTCALHGGTNATPSATGLTAKANLIGKGWTVNTN